MASAFKEPAINVNPSGISSLNETRSEAVPFSFETVIVYSISSPSWTVLTLSIPSPSIIE